jgi:hypothetical protein
MMKALFIAGGWSGKAQTLTVVPERKGAEMAKDLL